jgi:hypothetical protein
VTLEVPLAAHGRPADDDIRDAGAAGEARATAATAASPAPTSGG